MLGLSLLAATVLETSAAAATLAISCGIASYNPTIPSLYHDPEILQALPFFGELYDTFVNAGPRPSSVTGTRYDEVSNAFWNAVHDVLAGQRTAKDSLARLERTLQHIRGNEQW